MLITRFSLFFALFVCCSGALQAQTQKGSVILGGNIGFSSTDHDDYDRNSLYFNPYAAFFVANKVAVGAGIGLERESGDGPDYTTGSIKPLVRLYFNNSGDARFFGQFNLAFESYNNNDNDNDYNGFGAGLGAGMDYFLNPHVAIELFLGLESINYDDGDDDAYNTLRFNIGVATFLGK